MKVYYGCKYTPLEIIEGCGATPVPVTFESASFETAEAKITPNICGYAKSLIAFALSGDADALLLTTCCDAMRRTYDVLKKEMDANRTNLKFLYLLDLPHGTDKAAATRYAQELTKLQHALSAFLEKPFDEKKFLLAWERASSAKTNTSTARKPVFLLGAHATPSLIQLAEDTFGDNLKNLTCSGERVLPAPPRDLLRERVEIKKKKCSNACLDDIDERDLSDRAMDSFDGGGFSSSGAGNFARNYDAYAAALLRQTPCYRMIDPRKRQELLREKQEEAGSTSAIFHTMKFCDFYGFEHLQMTKNVPGNPAETTENQSENPPSPAPFSNLRVVKIETEGTPQSAGQIKTRLQAFAESINTQVKRKNAKKNRGKNMPTFVMGIDSGSTSTDAVILDEHKNIVSSVILGTGANAMKSAEAAQEKALEQAGLSRDDLSLVVATGYGREAILDANTAITEITCHAKGAHFLSPKARTIIDIGGQDSKVIRIDENGNVETFVMNDKCAAGTGRFLEALARTMELSLEDFANAALRWKKGRSRDVTISSMCTVFAESEVVSLVADNEDPVDIIHGLNRSVAQKTASLAKRAKAKGPYLMTGGVANNKGVVTALEEAFSAPIATHKEAQIAGALGAALLGLESLINDYPSKTLTQNF